MRMTCDNCQHAIHGHKSCECALTSREADGLCDDYELDNR